MVRKKEEHYREEIKQQKSPYFQQFNKIEIQLVIQRGPEGHLHRKHKQLTCLFYYIPNTYFPLKVSIGQTTAGSAWYQCQWR
jgi:hypothetical protein